MKKGITVLLLFFSLISYAQDENNRFVIGLGLNAIDYFPIEDMPNGNDGGFMNELFNSKDHWNVGGPRINATYYWKHKISFDAAFSLNTISKFGDVDVENRTYYAFDLHAQYSFLKPEKKFQPYLLIGAGYSSVFYGGGTFNSGIGANYWISDSIGINAQGLYKYNSDDYKLYSHFYYSLGVVFKLNSNGGGSKSGSKWNKSLKHCN
ncbi:hypothetical protein R3X25_04220 [Lutibacter sp. TH_r2]|uniref:hypothetical protein n=1 Tax=Lutibacter sp. TH_r2 TaxID=3082083 RepID=UPI002954FC89|nr:hypothetical protein [Lutibacter sp. TH_r2]MDV7186476.1 hypothetical protein [Lutibacter sp. TH_r2]